MKLYGSLIYREFKLMRTRSLIMLVLFLLTGLLMLTPFLLAGITKPAAGDPGAFDIAWIFSLMLAAVGGIMAGTNNGVQKADIRAGWKSYSAVLPPTPAKRAAADTLMKLLYAVFFGLLTVGFAAIIGYFTGCNVIPHTINVYIAAAAAAMLIDVIYTAVISLAKNDKDLKIYAMAAFFGIFLLFEAVSFVRGMFTGDADKQQTAGGVLLSDEQFNSITDSIGSGTVTLIVIAVFAVVTAAYFIVLWRSFERREP